MPNTAFIPRSLRSNYPYYNITAANVVRPIALDMIATAQTDQRPRKIESAKMRKSLATLEKIVSRGAMWLVDHDNTEGRVFREWRRNVFIKKNYPDQSVIIEWKFGGLEVTKGEMPMSRKEKMKDAMYTHSWQEGIDNFINDGEEGSRLEISDLKLSPEDISNVRGSLVGMESMVKVVEISYSKIILEK